MQNEGSFPGGILLCHSSNSPNIACGDGGNPAQPFSTLPWAWYNLPRCAVPVFDQALVASKSGRSLLERIAHCPDVVRGDSRDPREMRVNERAREAIGDRLQICPIPVIDERASQ